MKIILTILVASLFIQRIKPPNYLHIGFTDGKPVFRETRGNKIFTSNEQGKLTEININSSNGVLEYVNGCASIYTKHEVLNRINFRSNSGIERNYESTQSYIQMSLSEDCNYFAFEEDAETISVFINGIFAGKITGGNPQISGNYIYYNSYKGKVDAFVDIYRCKITDLKIKELVLSDVFEPGILVFDQGKYVACEIPRHGIPTKIVYAVETKDLKIIESSEIPKHADNPIFFSATKCLKYYKSAGLVFSEDATYK